ncbi:MAG: exosortase/archaeosortase family protein [Candidatus Babeliales bacterium]
MKKENIIQLIVIAIVTLIAYIPTIGWMYDRWTAAESYYSHGALIPLISAFLIWFKRKELMTIAPAPAYRWGWGLFISGILIHLISAFWQVYFSSGFALIPIIMGLVLLALGNRYLKRLLFPILFLIFMIPLPMVAIANISFRLKLFASQISVFFVNAMGIRAVREGSIIKTAHSYLVVEDPCSGIRSLIALIALGCLMAYLSKLSRPRKIILFLSSVPIAVFSNVIRIISLTLVSEMYGSEIATGTFHDVMGVLVFVIAFVCLTAVSKLLHQ